MHEARETVSAQLRKQARWCSQLGSPLYADVLEHTAQDVEFGGPSWDVLQGHESDPADSALALRLMAAVHRLVLQGRLTRLAAFYPSAGGHDDLQGAWRFFRQALDDHRNTLRSLLDRPVQTNEVERCAGLLCGFLLVIRSTGLPIRLRELGTSAGLNLRWDCYRYEVNGSGWGDPHSPVRFADAFTAPLPVLDATAKVIERCGCDQAPVDPSSVEGRLTLESYVWADQADRLERLRNAIQIAHRIPASIDRADAAAWLSSRALIQCGSVTVVFHSILWQYLSDATRVRIEEILERAGNGANEDSPLAWLRMEPGAGQADIRLKLWPGGADSLIATAGFHGRPVHWLTA